MLETAGLWVGVEELAIEQDAIEKHKEQYRKALQQLRTDLQDKARVHVLLYIDTVFKEILLSEVVSSRSTTKARQSCKEALILLQC